MSIPTMVASHRFGRELPQRTVAPTDPTGCAEALAAAAADGLAVIPWGGGIEQDLGYPPTRADILLSTSYLSEVLAYAPEDLTLSVRAGITLEAIDAVLRAHRQFLPLDLPEPSRATIGGVVSTGSAPLRRFKYGGIRDVVIGMEIVLSDGSLCKTGGRVVKNVAGYDLCKLLTGSLGTLGVIVGVNLKVQPIPSRRGVVIGRFADKDDALSACAGLATQALGFGALSLCYSQGNNHALPGRDGSEEDEAHIYCFVEGFQGSVMRQVKAAVEEIARCRGECTALEGGESVQASSASLLAWRVGRSSDEDILLRCAVAPARLSAALTVAESAFAHSIACEYQVDAGVGQFFVKLMSPEHASCTGAVEHLRSQLLTLGGHLVVASASAAFRRTIDPWGAPPSAKGLAISLKQAFDPSVALNPGRFSYGI